MRAVIAVVAAVTIAGTIVTASAGNRKKFVRLAQSSTTTNCMMTCNSQAASCQTSCVVPGTQSTNAASGIGGLTGTGAFGTSNGTGSAVGTGNATASVSCLSNCSSRQLACQTDCARISPSQ